MNTNVLTTGKLISLLQMFGVPVENWGKGESKDVSHFYKEIDAGESYLRIDQKGLARVVEIVKMYFKSPQPGEKVVLKEIFQILPNGRKKIRNQEPGGKIQTGEKSTSALEREIFEKLDLLPAYYKYKSLPVEVEFRPSKSYPGIICQYVIHRFEIVPNIGTHILQREFEIVEKNGTVLHFEWVPEK